MDYHYILFVIFWTIITIIINCIRDSRSEHGEMDVEWDEEDCVWNASLHIPSGIDYSKKKKLILKINHKL